MSACALTPLAKAGIFEIWCFIAQDNEDAAGRVEQEIYRACAFLAAAPLRGHSRRDLTARDLRFWTSTRYPSCIVVHRWQTTPLEIVAVLDGKRNLARDLPAR